MSQAYVYDIVRYRLSCLCAKVSAEGCRSHLGYVRECLQAYLLLVMHVYVFLHLSHPHTLRSFLHIGKGTAGQEMIILLERKFIQNLQEFEHTVKTWLSLSDGGYLTVQFHDGIQFECHSPFGIVKESSEAAQLIFGQELLSQQVGWKLYGNLMYGMTLAVILVPGMFETTSHQYQVIFSKYLYGITYYASGSITMLHEVEFHSFMLVQWISESLLVAIHHIETVLLR